MSDDSNETGCGIFILIFFVISFCGWINHLMICFTEDRWGFLIAGALFFPVGVIHGIGRWFGAW
jgi:hypothetical protein